MAEVTSLVLAVDSTQVQQASKDLDRLAKSGAASGAATEEFTSDVRAMSAAVKAAVSSISGLATDLQKISNAGQGAEAAIQGLKTDLSSVGQSAKLASDSLGGLNDRLEKSGRSASRGLGETDRVARRLRTTFDAIASSLVARAIIRAADTYANLNARLRLVTRSASEFAQVQQQIFDISQRTRVGLEQTSDLFGSLARSTEALGVSQQDVLGVTETINQAMLVSGTSAQSAAAALVQLGQGFASGTLRGEELNSVLEQAPRLARAIADGLGVPIGKLRELGQAGELTAERVFQALQKSSQQIQREFDSLPLTIGQATTQASNALLKLIGVLDETSGASRGLAEAISSAAGFIGELADEIRRGADGADDIGVIAQAFIVVDQTVRVVWANLRFVFQGIGREIGGIAAQIAALATLDLDGFRAISDAMREDAERARRELDAYEKRVLNVARIQFRADDQSDAEARRLGLARPAATPSAGGSGPGDRARPQRISEAERYLRSLQDQLQATQDLSVAEKLLDDIQRGRLGKITQAQEAELLGIALQIDAAEALKKSIEEREEAEKKAAQEIARIREEAFEASQRQIQAAAEEVARLIDGNQALREEIELIGKSAEEKGRLEQARIANAIAAKEEELASLQNAGATQAEIQALQQQIALLRERRDLLGVRGVTQQLAEDAQRAKDFAREVGASFQSAFESAIIEGGRLQDVLKGIADDLLRLVIRNQITGPLAQTIGGFDFGSLFGGGRANGGGVRRGMFYEVNERGPELLTVGNRQYLMMGDQSGTVTPAGQGGAGAPNLVVQVVNNTGVQATTRQENTADGVRVILDAVAGDISAGGRVAVAMSSTFGLNRGAGTPRRTR